MALTFYIFVLVWAVAFVRSTNGACCETTTTELRGPFHEKEFPFPNQNPLDEDTVRRARAHVGDVSNLQRFLCSAAKGKTLHVVVVGGSVTAGTQCEGVSSKDIACAWPARFGNWLDAAFPKGAPHLVENLSERASSSLVATEILSPHRSRLAGVDLFVIDYSVNDASNIQIQPRFRKTTEQAEHMHRHRNSSTSSSSSSSSGGDGVAAPSHNECTALSGAYRDRLMIGTERLVRWCISLPSHPAVLFFDTFNPRVDWHKQAQEVHLTVASYYQIPMVSYRDAVWRQWKALSHSAHGSPQPLSSSLASSSFEVSKMREARSSSGAGRGGKRGLVSAAGTPLGDNSRSSKRRKRDRFREGDGEYSGSSAEAGTRMLLSSGEYSAGGGGTSTTSSASSPLCEHLGLAPQCANALWTVHSLHPPWHVHQLLADLLALTLADEYAALCAKEEREAAAAAAAAGTSASPWLALSSADAWMASTASSSSSSASPFPSYPAELDKRHPTRTVPPLFGGTGQRSHGGGGGGAGESTSSEQACGTPLSVMSTLRTMAMFKSVRPLGDHHGWSLVEDVPGKPGWIAETDGAEIVFELAFERGHLTIGYLRSYSNLGKAEVWLSSANEPNGAAATPSSSSAVSAPSGALMTAASPLVLDGIWEEHKSELEKSVASGLGHGRLRVHFRNRCSSSGSSSASCKFKLLLLMSC